MIPDIPDSTPQHIPSQGKIGVIFCPSGSGKTTTGERSFGWNVSPKWNSNKAICQHFRSLNDVEKKFKACSSSISLWLSKYQQISQGEQDQVNIASQMGSSNVLTDEFTWNLDRITAKNLAVCAWQHVYK